MAMRGGQYGLVAMLTVIGLGVVYITQQQVYQAPAHAHGNAERLRFLAANLSQIKAAQRQMGLQLIALASEVRAQASGVQRIEKLVNAATADRTAPSKNIEAAACSVNPSWAYEASGRNVSECYSRPIDSEEDVKPDKVIMLSLDSPTSLESFKVRKDHLLRKFDLRLERFEAVNGMETFGSRYQEVADAASGAKLQEYTAPNGKKTRKGSPGFLKPGERGYLASMESLFEQLLTTDARSVLVLDDDALFHCNFNEELARVVRQPRCGGHISKQQEKGGVLMLGAAVWIDGTYPRRGQYCGGWNLVRQDLANSKAREGAAALCFNTNSKIYGSFGVIYHRAVFRAIADWCKTADVPFDHIYPHLNSRGHVVRVAWPNLIIQDVGHESSVDPSRAHQANVTKRAQIHKWKLGDYCSPSTDQPHVP